MEMRSYRQARAFTLIELLVVISIIIVLMGLLFPAFRGVQDQAKRTQAKNDLTQIVTAVNAFYTEYGKYPLTPATPGDTTYGAGVTNNKLLNELRNQGATENPRGIVFISPPDAKDANVPRSGIAGASSSSAGQYFDPWGKPYMARLDTDYDNQVDNPYTADTGAGSSKARQGVVAWSSGDDGVQGTDFKASDDVISWQ